MINVNKAYFVLAKYTTKNGKFSFARVIDKRLENSSKSDVRLKDTWSTRRWNCRWLLREDA